MIQVFESWAHQMIPSQFETFAKPYADLAMSILKQRHPDVPVIYFANGGSSYLESQRDTQVGQRDRRWRGNKPDACTQTRCHLFSNEYSICLNIGPVGAVSCVAYGTRRMRARGTSLKNSELENKTKPKPTDESPTLVSHPAPPPANNRRI